MDLGQLILGAIGIYVGAKKVKSALEPRARPRTQLRGAAPFLPGGAGLRSAGSAGPKQRPPMNHRGKHVQTLAGPMRMTRATVNNLDDRMAKIKELAVDGKFDPTVIAWTRAQLTRKCRNGENGEQWCIPEKDTKAEISAIFHGLRRDIRYTSDIAGADTYAHPRVTLRLKSGDCDDYSSLGCAALMSAGIPCRFKVVRTKDSDSWNHIFIQGGTPKHAPREWFSLDASVPVKPGWEPPPSMVAEHRIFNV
jgi:predicted transglutaminase-like cysteine proteinase